MELLWEIGWTPLNLMLIAGKDGRNWRERSETQKNESRFHKVDLPWKLSRNLHQFAALVSKGSLWNGKFIKNYDNSAGSAFKWQRNAIVIKEWQIMTTTIHN